MSDAGRSGNVASATRGRVNKRRPRRILVLVVCAGIVVAAGVAWRAAEGTSTAAATPDPTFPVCGEPHCGVPKFSPTLSPTRLAQIPAIKRPAFEGCSTITCTAPTDAKTTDQVTSTCGTETCGPVQGIFVTHQTPYTNRTFGVDNVYSGFSQGRHLLVYAGGTRRTTGAVTTEQPVSGEPPITHGAVIVELATSSTFNAPNVYGDPTPAVGALTIGSFATGVVTMTDSNGSRVTFDVSSDAFTAPVAAT